VEYLAAQQYGMEKEEFRRLAWTNLARVIRETNISSLIPKAFSAFFAQVE
jgi:hypothetical protein